MRKAVQRDLSNTDEPFAAFFGFLRQNGFQVGLRERIQADQLLFGLAAKRALPAGLNARLSLLRPLVCRNAEQQRQFPELVARWAPPEEGLIKGLRRRHQPGAVAAGKLRRWPLRIRLALVGVVLMLVVGLVALAWQNCAALGWCQPPAPATDTTQVTTATTEPADTSSDASTQPDETLGSVPIESDFPRLQQRLRSVLTIVGGVSMAVLFAGLVLLSLRRLALQPLRTDAPLEQRSLFSNHARLILKVPPLLKLVSRELRRPRRTDRLELDLRQTISATLRSGGALTPQYRARQATPEYMMLIDQRSPHDQLARCAEDIVWALDRQGVVLHVFRFAGDPSVCMPMRVGGSSGSRPAQGARQRLQLGELVARAEGQRILLFAEAGQLVDPLTGELRPGVEALEAHGRCMLFTSQPVPGWGQAEQALGQHGILVLPLQMRGLASGADWLSSQRALLTLDPDWPSTYPPRLLLNGLLWLARVDKPPAEEIDGLLFELELYLGAQRFQWLCGCASFPVPSWPITLALAPLFLQPGEDRVTGAVALASLPWFREGTWPLWLRESLQQRLTPELRTAVATEIQGRLEGARLGRPVGSGEVLAQVALAMGTGARLRRAWRGFVARLRGDLPEGRLSRDVLFLGIVQHGVAQHLMQMVPERLRQQVFKEGVPILGFRPWVPALVLPLVIAGIAIQLPPLQGWVQARLESRLTPASPVPLLVGLTLRTAESELLRLGGRREVVHVDDPDFCPGMVIDQAPAPGNAWLRVDPVRLTVAQNKTLFYNMTCRGTNGNVQLGYQATGQALAANQPFSFEMSKGGTGPASNGLEPGQCAWLDRGFRTGEPLVIRAELPSPRASALSAALDNVDRYVTFRVVNKGPYFRAGCVVDANARPPGSPVAPAIDPQLAAQLEAQLRTFFGGPQASRLQPALILARGLAGVEKDGLVALALALAKDEPGDLFPRVEAESRLNTSPGGQPFDLYEPGGARGKSYGNTQPGDGARYRGRGILMIVGRANYDLYGKRIGVDLVDKPELAAEPDIAINILVSAFIYASTSLQSPIGPDDIRIVLRRINGSATQFDRVAKDFELARPIARALDAAINPGNSGSRGGSFSGPNIVSRMGPLERGVSYNQGDYANRDAKSPEACSELCGNDARCVAMSFIPSQQRCWLKDRLTGNVAKSVDMISARKVQPAKAN
ncbi:PAN domain-containing protein [Variovorax robiniae]|uniref:PAN domain-containing protein n=1 Tax=Variovorax robiniae TaxID=1836199 RepID=A0ABU8XGT6_9BURK